MKLSRTNTADCVPEPPPLQSRRGHGLFVSSSPYTEAAIAECKNMLSQRVIVAAEVNEIVLLLEDPDASLADWLRAKVMAPALPAITPRF